jgi:ABC-type transport system involved in multi-copper enzyme maturation permease subunit
MGRAAWFLVARTLGFFVVLEGILIPAILYWPTFEENIGFFKKLTPLLKGKNLVGMLEVTGIQGYVIAQHFFKGCMVLGIPAAVLFAMGAVAGEAHRGTLEIWLARPQSRWRILLERWLEGAAAVVIPVFATSLTLPWLLSYVDETMAYGPIWLASVHSSSLLLATYSATFLLSAVGRRPVLIAFCMLSFMIAQGAIYIVEIITHWSIYRLVDIPEYLKIYETGRLDPATLVPLFGAALLFLIASLIAFQRRVP